MPADNIPRTLKSNVSDNGIYTIEDTIADTEEQTYLMPNRRLDSIGWQYSGASIPEFYGTLSSQDTVLTGSPIWERLLEDAKVNNAITAIRVVGTGDANVLISVRTIYA